MPAPSAPHLKRTPSPCTRCPLRPDCRQPCDKLQPYLEKPIGQLPHQRVFGFYFSWRGLVHKDFRRLQHCLTPRQQEMVDFYYGREYSLGQTAIRFNVSKTAVSRCLTRARKRVFLEQCRQKKSHRRPTGKPQ